MNLLSEFFSIPGLSPEPFDSMMRPLDPFFHNLDPFSNTFTLDEMESMVFIDTEAHSQDQDSMPTDTSSEPEMQSEIASPAQHDISNISNCNCKDDLVDVKMMGLVPSQFWDKYQSSMIPLQTIIEEFFYRRTSNTTKFIFKLYNALRITTYYPEYKDIIGVYWISEEIFVVLRHEFAVLNNIKIEKGALFHQHGNFTTHGFEQISTSEIASKFGKEFVTEFNIKNTVFCQHKFKAFTKRTIGEQILEECPYRNDHKKTYKSYCDKDRRKSKKLKRSSRRKY